MKKPIETIKNELIGQKDPWVEEAVHAVFAASEIFETYVSTRHAEYGITQRGIAVLYSIVMNNGKLSQKRMPKILNRTKQAVASALANLEKRNLIERETVGQDRRKRMVKITKEGLKIASECLPLRAEFYDCVRSGLSRDDAERLVTTLKTLSHYLATEMKKKTQTVKSKKR